MLAVSHLSDIGQVFLLLWASLSSPAIGGLGWQHSQAPSVLLFSDLSYLGQDKPVPEGPTL